MSLFFACFSETVLCVMPRARIGSARETDVLSRGFDSHMSASVGQVLDRVKLYLSIVVFNFE